MLARNGMLFREHKQIESTYSVNEKANYENDFNAC